MLLRALRAFVVKTKYTGNNYELLGKRQRMHGTQSP
jgi:hypothetical protein